MEKPDSQSPSQPPADSCSESRWFDTPLGRYLAEREQSYFDRAVADVFGYNALQLGLPEMDLLQASRIPLKVHAHRSPGSELRTDFHDLPLAGNSIDLVVMPHVLEFHEHPHQILREVNRVLMPEGHLVLACFNPWSLWGIRRAFARSSEFPWQGRFINLPRVKDWLGLLGFEIIAGQMSCYAPPCAQQKWMDRCRFMEPAGDRWWPIAGGVYFLQAVKRVRGVRLIMPKWTDRLYPGQALAAASKKVTNDDSMAARSRLRAVDGGVTERSVLRYRARSRLRIIEPN